MARNEEKHCGRLNRLWLQQLDEEHAKKNPPRPGLGSLHTAQDVKKWMPRIKKDIDFYLKQTQVGCYPDRKITEFSQKIDSLSREYKAYLRKYRELEGCGSTTPWSDVPYSRKHKTVKESYPDAEENQQPVKKLRSSVNLLEGSETSFSPLSLPVLEKEDSYKDIYGYNIVNPEKPALSDTDSMSHDLPLEFDWMKNRKALDYNDHGQSDVLITALNCEPLNFEWRKNGTGCGPECFVKEDPKLLHTMSKCSYCIETLKDKSSVENMSDCFNRIQKHNVKCICTCTKVESNSNNLALEKREDVNNGAVNVLNLPYSDSSSEEDT